MSAARCSSASTAAGGRGGGKPTHAEGRLPAGTAWPAAIAGARA